MKSEHVTKDRSKPSTAGGRRSPKAPGDPLLVLERLVVAEEVAAVLRHELRNNLSSIHNAAFYLKRRAQHTHFWGVDPRVEQFFTLIEEMVVASTRVLEDRLHQKHRLRRTVEVVSGKECVERAAACARLPPSVDLEIDADDSEIEVDVAEVVLGIRCILENAAEAMPEGGRVEVSAKSAGKRFVVSVTDRGSGIDAADREKIFDAFHTTKDGHAGLGLNIARRVANHYRGELSVRSTASGTTVALALPLSRRLRSVEKR